MADQPRLALESIAGQRPYQEDAVLAETLDDGRVLVAVADGMGGHAAGEIASAIALETLVEALQDGRSLAEAFELANRRVHERAREPGRQGMGTTLVAALLDGGEVHLANVGDSRGYVISGSGIRRLTVDHSFVAEAVKRGQSEAEAMAGPWKDALTRSIGTEAEVEVDLFGPMPFDTNSALLVCSDGLYKTLTDGDLLRIYAQSGSPRGAAQSLVTSALENGSDDNISVAIAEVGEFPRASPGGTIPLATLPPRREPGAGGAGAAVGTTGAGAGAQADTGPTDPPAEADPPAELDLTAAESGLGFGSERRPPLPGPAVAAVLVVVGALLALLLLGG